MIYVTYDDAGNLTGKYVQELHPDHAARHIEVTPDQAVDWLQYRANAARTGLELAPPVSPAPPAVPQRVPMLNAVLVMIEAGLWKPLNAHIETLPETDRMIARAYLDRALTMARDHDLVLSMPATLGISEAQIDALFMQAGALNV